MPKYVTPSVGLIVVVVDVSGGGVQLFKILNQSIKDSVASTFSFLVPLSHTYQARPVPCRPGKHSCQHRHHCCCC